MNAYLKQLTSSRTQDEIPACRYIILFSQTTANNDSLHFGRPFHNLRNLCSSIIARNRVFVHTPVSTVNLYCVACHFLKHLGGVEFGYCGLKRVFSSLVLCDKTVPIRDLKGSDLTLSHCITLCLLHIGSWKSRCFAMSFNIITIGLPFITINKLNAILLIN